MTADSGGGGVAPAPGLVDSALHALSLGANPFSAVVFAVNAAFALRVPMPPGADQLPPTDSSGSNGSPGAPSPNPPPPQGCQDPPPGVRCHAGWYWDTVECACLPLPNSDPIGGPLP